MPVSGCEPRRHCGRGVALGVADAASAGASLVIASSRSGEAAWAGAAASASVARAAGAATAQGRLMRELSTRAKLSALGAQPLHYAREQPGRLRDGGVVDPVRRVGVPVVVRGELVLV